jgi:enediyne polyketide synthase
MLAEQAAAEFGEEPEVAAARVWAATECQVKAGGTGTGPLILSRSPEPGWVTFASGRDRVATAVARLAGTEHPVVFAVLSRVRPDGNGGRG